MLSPLKASCLSLRTQFEQVQAMSTRGSATNMCMDDSQGNIIEDEMQAIIEHEHGL